MHDLIGAYARLERLYRGYIRSAFPLRTDTLSAERDQVLRANGVLSQEPLLETVPVYPSSPYNLAGAAAELARTHPDYADLAKLGQQLFPSDRNLYKHQWQSLQE